MTLEEAMHRTDTDRYQLCLDLGQRHVAQLSREVEFAIPREMNQEQGIDLARDFVQAEFVNAELVADLNVHWEGAPMGSQSRMRMSC